jgi:hypothetical protein
MLAVGASHIEDFEVTFNRDWQASGERRDGFAQSVAPFD